MDVAIMTMPRREAELKLRAYRRQLHRRADGEFEAAAAGYQALAEGKVLLNLDDVIAAAPTDTFGRPRLAVCRADRRQVHFEWGSDPRAVFNGAAGWTSLRRQPNMAVTVNMGRNHPRPNDRWTIEGYALVPMTPADVLTAAGVGGSTLNRYHVLWEVEAWADRRLRSTPDRDPYLLQHIHGALYVVVAEWNLTDLERAIMSGRRDA